MKLNERTRAGLRFAGLALVLVVTVMVSVSVISYVFTWKPDQSALSGGEPVRNAAASGGLSIGHFLVTQSFGLAAFCLVALLIAWCVKLFWSASPIKPRKAFFGLLSLSFVLSWILAFAGLFLPWPYVFGGGLGGRAGAALVGWMVSKMGEIVVGLILAVLLCAWFYCMSRRFQDWLMGIKPEPSEPDPASEMPVETSDTFQPEPEEEPLEPEEDAIDQIPINETGFVSTPTHEDIPPRKKKEKTPAAEESEALNVVKDDTLDKEVEEPLKPIDNRLDPPDGLPKYKTPDLGLLGDYIHARHEVSQDELRAAGREVRGHPAVRLRQPLR